MDENPYQAPVEEGATTETPAPSLVRRLWVGGVCLAFAGLFGLMFVSGLRRADATLGSLVMVGWCLFTSVGFIVTGVGFMTWKRSLAATGACIVIISLATMFTLVIGFLR